MLSAPDTFCYKKFFKLCGLSSKTPKEVKDVFQILDEDNSGYIEHSELKCVKGYGVSALPQALNLSLFFSICTFVPLPGFTSSTN